MMKNQSKYVFCGILGAAFLGTAAMTLNVTANDKNTKKEQIPSAGIAKIFATDTDDNKSDINAVMSAGIANVLANYKMEDEKDATVQAVDTILNMLPQEEVAPENVENEAKPDEQKEIVSVVEGYTNLGVANVTNYLNVRENPDIEGKLLGKLPMNAGCEILETLDGWYKISSGNVEGYVSAEFLLVGEEANARASEALSTVAKVNADMLMVREEPNTDCTILTRVAENEEIEVVEVLDGWVKVNIDNRIGFVCADYVDVYRTLPKGVTLKELSYGDGVSNIAVDMIEYAKQFLGNPYVYGGTSLTNGTDCSGFTMRIYQHFGYSISRTSRSQANDGRRVSLSEIQPGDLLFYSRGGTIGHVAMYIGNGQIIHASTERTGIIIGNAFYTTPTCAVRILN